MVSFAELGRLCGSAVLFWFREDEHYREIRFEPLLILFGVVEVIQSEHRHMVVDKRCVESTPKDFFIYLLAFVIAVDEYISSNEFFNVDNGTASITIEWIGAIDWLRFVDDCSFFTSSCLIYL